MTNDSFTAPAYTHHADTRTHARAWGHVKAPCRGGFVFGGRILGRREFAAQAGQAAGARARDGALVAIVGDAHRTVVAGNHHGASVSAAAAPAARRGGVAAAQAGLCQKQQHQHRARIIPSHFIYRVAVPAAGQTNPIFQQLAGRPIYVGETGSLGVRCGQHSRMIVASGGNKKDKKMLYQKLELMNGDLKDMMRPVEGLPHGVPAHLASEMEMYYIRKLGTLYDPADELGQHMCNLTVGDPTRDEEGHKVYMTKQRYDELEG